MENFQYLEQAADNYDPDYQGYDDENFAGKNANRPMRVKQKASFDLTMVNASADVLTFELFNELKSFVENKNLSIITSATVTYIPQSSDEGLAAAGVGIVGYDQFGKLRASGAAGVTALTVDCPQYTYRGLMKSSGRRPFTIVGIRMTVTADAQIDNEIRHFQQSFLGSKSENTLSPRTFFNPQQNQNFIIDINCNFPIDDQKGLLYKLNAGQTVKWNVLIER